MRILLTLSLLLVLASCKTKYRATEQTRSESELSATQHSQAVQLHTRATEAVTRLTESDSLHIIIKDYRADGSLARITELVQGSKREQTDNTRQTDSLQAVQRSRLEVKASEQTTTTRKAQTETKAMNGSWLWWLFVGLLLGLLVVVWLYLRSNR